jgi:CheY-like chemotaxis protein
METVGENSSRPGETRPRILIVEDDGVLRTVLARLLTREGYTVLQARHGQEALEHLRADAAPPGLLLLDMSTPVMSGAELLNVLDSSPSWSCIPVIVLSRTPPPASQLSIPRAWLQKPMDPDRLLELVRAECHR